MSLMNLQQWRLPVEDLVLKHSDIDGMGLMELHPEKLLVVKGF